ncbi:UNVERIFIED_CONTAM: phage portal protein, partial [Kocuria sp. CPCC 205274]
MSRIKLQIIKLGARLKMVETLDKITNHPDINMDSNELERIIRNKRFYRGEFDDVTYINSEGESCRRPFRSLNVPKILSRKLSKLVFNEGVSIEVNDKSAQEFIDDVLKFNRFEKNFGEELEGGYAVSGLVIRLVYDDLAKTIRLTYCSADNFFPLSGNANDVDEGALRTVYTKIEKREPVYYTLLEIHKKTATGYHITNELYRSTQKTIVGVNVPLDTIEETSMIEPEVELQGFTKPLFTYIKLAGKNNISYGSPLGLGVIDNAYKQFFDLNEKYDQFMWEIEEAGRKILASDHFFRVKYDANGRPIRRFDSKTSVFQKLRADEEFIDEFAPSLRSSEFIESINFILRIIEMQNGFSAGTFSFDGQSVKTATEIVSENTDTFQTRQDNVLIVSECLSDLVI